MERKDVLPRYLEAIQRRDLPGILALFTKRAVVKHPMLGELPVREFFPKLLAATSSDGITNSVVLHAEGDSDVSALYFRDKWSRADGASFDNDIVLVFRFDQSGAVNELQVVFDTWPARQERKAQD